MDWYEIVFLIISLLALVTVVTWSGWLAAWVGRSIAERAFDRVASEKYIMRATQAGPDELGTAGDCFGMHSYQISGLRSDVDKLASQLKSLTADKLEL